MLRAEPVGEEPELFSIEDERFDQIYPPEMRKLSALFWTPVAVAVDAAKLLVTAPGTRVLDLGCGAGKFCLVAASTSEGRFTGVEQRRNLVDAAREAAARLGLTGSWTPAHPPVEFVHANVTDVSFGEYDAFYIFNPFAEHLDGHRIDTALRFSADLFRRYTSHVADELGAMPCGTRVVTYMGYADEIPACYRCEAATFNDDLKLWIKTREHDPEIERLALRAPRSYRGSVGWTSGRRYI